MADSIFDPQNLLDETFTEPSERREPLDIGDYTAIIGEITVQDWAKKDGSAKGKKWNVPLEVQIPAEMQERLQLPFSALKLIDSVMLDLTPSGGIDMAKGKNGRIRVYREALDMNKPGDTFSARKMQGQMVLVKIAHEEYNGAIQERIAGVAKLI